MRAAGLDRSLRPPVLLRFERVHLHRHFRRRDEVGNEDEPPAPQLRPVAEIQVLGERVVLPPAGVVNRRPPPDAGGPVEVEEPAAPIARAMLEDEMGVEQNRLNPREQRIVPIDVPPPGLDHSHARVVEMRHQTQEKVRRRDEVGIEDRDEFPPGDLQAGLQRARLEAGAVRAVVVLDVDALGGQPADGRLGDAASLVSGVVEHLDFEPLARIVDAARRVD
jgi:hypothetical protein